MKNKFVLFGLTLFLASCLDSGNKIAAQFNEGECIRDKDLQVYEITEVMNKHYKYRHIQTKKGLVYPIAMIDKSMTKISCPGLDDNSEM